MGGRQIEQRSGSMRALIQRVSEANVAVANQVVGRIGRGLVVFLGVTHQDGEAEAAYLAKKIAGLRIFEDEHYKMNRALLEIGGAALVVSQFTLFADVRKGRRPSFTASASPGQAEPLYETFCQFLADAGVPVARGVFQAHMQVALVNDGPVTLWLDTQTLQREG